METINNQRKAAYMQITRDCNNECVFCSNPKFEKSYSLKETKKQILDFKKDGVTEIILTGGEPTLCEFLPEVFGFLEEEELEFRMISNGVLLEDKHLVKKLYDAGLRKLNLSIHSHNKEKSERLNPKKNYFEKSLRGIKNCVDIGIIPIINCAINSINCAELDVFVSFITKRFPQISHFVFNGLDPGKADGNIKSRAGENKWVIPRFVDVELSLKKAVNKLRKQGKSFRVERIPLCYMNDFEECCTETRKIVKEEMYICSFIEKNKDNEVRIASPNLLRVKVNVCKYCKVNGVCAGIQKEYLEIYGEGEIYPVFLDESLIIRKVLVK